MSVLEQAKKDAMESLREFIADVEVNPSKHKGVDVNKPQFLFQKAIDELYIALNETVPKSLLDNKGVVTIPVNEFEGYVRSVLIEVASPEMTANFTKLADNDSNKVESIISTCLVFALSVACVEVSGKKWQLKPERAEELGIVQAGDTVKKDSWKDTEADEDVSSVSIDEDIFMYSNDAVRKQMRYLVPNQCKEYFPRVFCSEDKHSDNPLTDLDILGTAHDEKLHTLLIGETGSGKTLSLKALAFRLGVPYKSLSFNGACTIEDVLGSFIPATKKTVDEPNGKFGWYWTDGWLTKLARFGGIFVAEEINSAPPEILFVLHDLLGHVSHKLDLTALGGDVVDAHPDFFFAATMNPDYEGTVPMNKALMDRFDIILEYPYDIDVERNLIGDEILLGLANKLRALYPQQLHTPCSTRMLEQFERNRQLFGFRAARQIFVNKYGTADQSKVKEVFDLQMGQGGIA